ncbi:NADP-dependent 3-hydroxy acid dehydrogenase YdfG [Kineococcus xinjiangensis]|uniref:NADP-dependent 3-hydroxy acid dehydrogenase YdfG n=1 Tax=Kineococcus xinjiangensis TaxID=512762 RepID=A0A2S6IX80_9ACTN|nr:SDR family oxidoreductase [Kineococcus xinjiangensis]PPK98761.1 NADP-dependent 3-hydroxy acid dehydrogenase YdfG [Kineococcus xinjiangensis]
MNAPVLLVTGASSGIGAATARMAASRGRRLVLAARRADALRGLAAELGGASRAVAVPCDVTRAEDVDALVPAALAAFGRLDAVFANAGSFTPTSFLHGTGTPQQWRDMVLTNVLGTALVARAALPALIASRGHLVLTGSVAGRVVVPGQLYSATKWAVTAMAQSIRAEVTATGVRVTLVQPGMVDAGETSSDRLAEPRLRPEDVARAVLFALEQPPEVDIGEIVVRPTGQRPDR